MKSSNSNPTQTHPHSHPLISTPISHVPTHKMLLITSPSPHSHLSSFKTHFQNPHTNNPNSIFHHPIYPKHIKITPCCYRSSLSYVNESVSDDEGSWVSSASAVAAVIRNASSCSIDFDQIIERDPQSHGLVLPSPDFQRLCLDQLNLFRRIIDPNAILSVYVRPAGSYVMDRLELRRVTTYPTVNGSEIVILVGNFSVPAGLRGAESALSNQQAEAIPDFRAIVFPLVKHPFVVGFLVAELPHIDLEKGSHGGGTQLPSPEECYALPSNFDFKSLEIPPSVGNSFKHFNLSADQRLNAVNISSTVAMAYVMDQKSMLLQQTSWQNNIRMSNLVEQIRGPLSSIRTLTEMLSVQIKRNKIAHDVIEDIIVQGDRMRDTLQQLQDAVYLTKANIVRFNEESLKKMDGSGFAQPETRRLGSSSHLSFPSVDKKIDFYRPESSNLAVQDLEMPMPPLALAPLQEHNIRPCNVSDVLVDLVGAAQPLAQTQKRSVELREYAQCLQVCVEEPALRQALGNLIEGALLRTHVGGKVEIVSVRAPAGGVLVVIDDDGPDMHYMTQMHSLAPFGAELFSEQMVEDNMTWNFIAGLTVAREILESYGCVVRVISPRNPGAALGTGGTRVEVWLPSSSANNQKSAGHVA